MIKGDISRNELEDELLSYFEDITSDRNLFNEFENYLFEHHDIPRTKTSGILSGSIPISDISEDELYLITKLTYGNLKDKLGNKITELDPKEYFLPKEIDNGETYKEVRITDTSQKLTFDNVRELIYEQYRVYVCDVSLEKVTDIMSRGLYEYDPNTQRQLVKRVLKSGRISTKPPQNTKKINEIKKTLEKSSPNQNVIVFNVPPTGEDEFNYKNGKLEINVDGVKTRNKIIDGFNRFRAANALYRERPDIKCPFELKFFHMSDTMARLFIGNVNEQTKIEDYHVETMKEDEPYMAMVKAINTKGSKDTNALYMKITEDLFDVENKNYYTTFNIMNQALEFNFENKSKKLSLLERKKIQEYLLEAFIYVIGTFEKEFKNKKESREVSIVTEANTFIGFVAILSEVYDKYKDNWEDKILETLEEIDFYKTNILEKEWKEIGIYTKNINSTHIKKISNYFKRFVK